MMRDPKRPSRRSPSPGARSTAHFIRRPNMTIHRFPPPWSVEELEACFVMKDSARRHDLIKLDGEDLRRQGIQYSRARSRRRHRIYRLWRRLPNKFSSGKGAEGT